MAKEGVVARRKKSTTATARGKRTTPTGSPAKKKVSRTTKRKTTTTAKPQKKATTPHAKPKKRASASSQVKKKVSSTTKTKTTTTAKPQQKTPKAHAKPKKRPSASSQAKKAHPASTKGNRANPPQPKTSNNAGRPKKTREAAKNRVSRLFSKWKISERRQNELMSLVSSLFCDGLANADIIEQVKKKEFLETCASDLSAENVWDLLRVAAGKGMITHTPPNDLRLCNLLKTKYQWLGERLIVTNSAATKALAEQAATKLMDMIRNVCKLRNRREVHVGFAGGMTLRAVAKRLAQLLMEPHPDNPETLVFHAMVAGFDDDDFYADPNSFISYFVARKYPVRVRLVRLPLPGIIESARYQEFQSLPGIRRVFERRGEIDIIVTSGSLWSDSSSTLRAYLKAAAEESQHDSQSGDTDVSHSDDLEIEFTRQEVIGDLLWHPINKQGLVNVASKYKVTTLMELDDLPGFINNTGSVLLVMGCSGISGMPKSELLRTILDLHGTHNWVTDVVTDSPTVEGVVDPNTRHPGKPR